MSKCITLLNNSPTHKQRICAYTLRCDLRPFNKNIIIKALRSYDWMSVPHNFDIYVFITIIRSIPLLVC